MKKILLVEDDAIIASGLVYALEQENYSVVHCNTAGEAIIAAQNGSFDLALLDLQLPDGTGFLVREKLTDIAIIFLTVVDDEGSIVRAFDGGADDYITKPFRLRELLARIKRTLGAHSSNLMLGQIVVDTTAGKACVNGVVLDLTALEYRLLLTFASHRGQILSRVQILEHIWDSAGHFVEDNTLTVYIKRLREKLGASANIETVRGLGYRAH